MLDHVDHLVELYDSGTVTRRQLLSGLMALAVVPPVRPPSRPLGSSPDAPPLFRARTLNHVTLLSNDVARSKAFYQTLGGMGIHDEGPDYCEFNLGEGFLGTYAQTEGRRTGFDHFCLGVDDYDAQAALVTLRAELPGASPTLEPGEQVYVSDPDGVRVQLADRSYKR